MDAMKALHRAAGDPTRERQYRSQSCSMMRQAAQARRELLRMQAIRHEAEAWHDAQAAESVPVEAAEEGRWGAKSTGSEPQNQARLGNWASCVIAQESWTPRHQRHHPDDAQQPSTDNRWAQT